MTTRDDIMQSSKTLLANAEASGGNSLYVKAATLATTICNERITPYEVSVVLASYQLALVSGADKGTVPDVNWGALIANLAFAATFDKTDPKIRLPQANAYTELNLSEVAANMADQLAGENK